MMLCSIKKYYWVYLLIWQSKTQVFDAEQKLLQKQSNKMELGAKKVWRVQSFVFCERFEETNVL